MFYLQFSFVFLICSFCDGMENDATETSVIVDFVRGSAHPACDYINQDDHNFSDDQNSFSSSLRRNEYLPSSPAAKSTRRKKKIVRFDETPPVIHEYSKSQEEKTADHILKTCFNVIESLIQKRDDFEDITKAAKSIVLRWDIAHRSVQLLKVIGEYHRKTDKVLGLSGISCIRFNDIDGFSLNLERMSSPEDHHHNLGISSLKFDKLFYLKLFQDQLFKHSNTKFEPEILELDQLVSKISSQ